MRKIELTGVTIINEENNLTHPNLYVHDEGEYISDTIATHKRFYEQSMLYVFRALILELKPNGISGFIDIGANIGNHSAFIQNTISNTKNMILIEAVKENVKLALKNNPNALIINAAASNEAGSADFYVYEDNFGVGTLKSLWDPIYGVNKGPDWGKKVRVDKVPQIKIDDLYLVEVDAIKLDVEGAEKRVLKGMLRTLKQFEPIVWIEMLDNQVLEKSFEYTQIEIVNQLADLGYYPYVNDGMNYLFIKKEPMPVEHFIDKYKLNPSCNSSRVDFTK
ncbi:FkbM family methyltransferase [Prochlorococcus sp. MIT 1300]|uniref:FkbM family methyltransferase n=1 Tax=Prochlorococcus sp. MIT 1300 TaxID=3096218 RepID=UPI002A74AF73|nr:FkbM family methyltransferase [Prochlorococcus sp. MIT 1300]